MVPRKQQRPQEESRGLVKQKERGLGAHAPVNGSAEPSQSDDCDDVYCLGLCVHDHGVKRFTLLVNIGNVSTQRYTFAIFQIGMVSLYFRPLSWY
jgi:hypothetical protein